ncbi:MAG: MarR family winged helix-turn-helix transcriptional regulator [Alphaproteobacteria bacterium]|nr:MarR family winged helix-turn-helix transcriptional regulator [Alphaproteobacteria bacterium]MBU6471843.1 MarR family winged helix-turn-helix transcriptional regulator [Alphaproteobacteria bacterium]MDE2012326.1 winged helix-turn-helix transcriptional regulator [Alphaproteobacteria bacterium]MDE2072999.1 winged helix-turn-helix transcriptional regulator [Alphaproteobacteria bacterium]MDE2352068.1 winged helix-turn-helix transcriptional regulator [Alphaproteobacteria bacterium]
MRVQHDITDQIVQGCLMGRARVLTRVLTGIYDEALRPFGIKASQLNLLAVVAMMAPIRRTDIGRLIHLDPSTLTRNLHVMLSNGWIEEVMDNEDGRGLPLQATEKGCGLLDQLGPAWKGAQRKALKLLGEDGAALLLHLSGGLMGNFG